MFTIGRAKRRVLGISLGERGALVAEVSSNGGHRPAARGAHFTYPAGVAWDKPEQVGAALAAFLRDHDLHGRQAVFGIPAKWLMSRPQSLPPADEATAAAMLALRAEAEAAPELGEMVFDYAGEASITASTSVLLVGVPRRVIDRVLAIADAAGVQALAITPCALALDATARPDIGNRLLLSIRPEAVELLAREGDQLRFLRHLGSATAPPNALASELRRAATLLPAGSESEIVVWDDASLGAAALDDIRGGIGARVAPGDVRSLASGSGDAGAAAVALALPLMLGLRPAVDFLHPRLVKPRTANAKRRITVAATAVVALTALALYLDLSNLQRHLAKTEGDLKSITPAVDTAKPFVNTMQFAEAYQGRKPTYLACLRDVTQAIPEDGQAYLTGLHLDKDLKGDFAGRSASHQDVLNLMDRLNASGHFAELKRKIDGRGNGPEVMFSVTFRYVPAPK